MQNWFAKHAVKITAGLRLTFGAMVLAAVFLIGAIFHQVGGSFSRLFLFLVTDGTTVTVIAGLLVTPLFALAYATFKRAHHRTAIKRSLAEEVAAMAAAIKTCINFARGTHRALEKLAPGAPHRLAEPSRGQLHAFAPVGSIFQSTDTADLGLLTTGQLRALIGFHRITESVVATIDTVDDYDTIIVAFEGVRTVGLAAAKALSIPLDDKS